MLTNWSGRREVGLVGFFASTQTRTLANEARSGSENSGFKKNYIVIKIRIIKGTTVDEMGGLNFIIGKEIIIVWWIVCTTHICDGLVLKLKMFLIYGVMHCGVFRIECKKIMCLKDIDKNIMLAVHLVKRFEFYVYNESKEFEQRK